MYIWEYMNFDKVLYICSRGVPPRAGNSSASLLCYSGDASSDTVTVLRSIGGKLWISICDIVAK